MSRRGRVAAIIAAVLIVGAVALARVVLGVHFVSDVLAGITLGIGWVAVTTSAYVAWRRETGQPVERPAEVGTTGAARRASVTCEVTAPASAEGVIDGGVGISSTCAHKVSPASPGMSHGFSFRPPASLR